MGLIGQACERKLHENNMCTRFIHPSTHEICINLHSTISDGKEMKGSLVGDFTPLKNMKVSWDYYSQYMEKKHVPNHQQVTSAPKMNLNRKVFRLGLNFSFQRPPWNPTWPTK